MKKLNLCLILSFGLLSSIPMLAQAKAKEAICQIDEGGQIRYKGKCNFEPQGGEASISAIPILLKDKSWRAHGDDRKQRPSCCPSN